MKWKENEMKPENKKVVHQAIATFGRQNQCMQTIEELIEFEKELFENIHRGTDNRAKIVEELADVETMLEQIKMIYDIKPKEIEEVQDAKITRLKRTIEKFKAKQEAEKENPKQVDPKDLIKIHIDRNTSNGK